MKVKLQKKNKGMTLIEITLVIAILLSLIAILFIGIAAFKKGSDRAKCILNQSTVQKIVRSEANMQELVIGDALTTATLISQGYFSAMPACPEPTGSYTATGTVPPVGTIYYPCGLAATATYLHEPKNYTEW